ncbi:MAG: hypothetical protein ACLR23_03800 [Clostridia bacterium]
MPAGEGVTRGAGVEKGEKRGQRRWLAPEKCPPVEKVTRGSGVEKGRKGVRRRGLARENARR